MKFNREARAVKGPKKSIYPIDNIIKFLLFHIYLKDSTKGVLGVY